MKSVEVSIINILWMTFLIYAAMSFSILYFSMACVAQSTASCCMSSDISAFFITAFLSVMMAVNMKKEKTSAIKVRITRKHLDHEAELENFLV